MGVGNSFYLLYHIYNYVKASVISKPLISKQSTDSPTLAAFALIFASPATTNATIVIAIIEIMSHSVNALIFK